MNDTETTLHPYFPGTPLTIQKGHTGEAEEKVYVRGVTRGGHFDADELRDAIDKAVGPREPKPHEGNKPYRPLDRDRLLRHIEDVEAALTRRNARHEADQERIRELEAEVFTLREIKDSYEELKTAREYLDLAFGAAHVPADGMIHGGEEFLARAGDEIRAFRAASTRPSGLSGGGYERRLLDPRPEPTAEEKRRKEYEDAGLQEWEIELLMGGAA